MSLKPKERKTAFNLYHKELSDYLKDDDDLPPRSTKRKLYEHQTKAVFAINCKFKRHQIALAVLPTGCGKSGIAVLAPYIVNAKKVLIITPSMTITKQVFDDFCSPKEMFLLKRGIIVGDPRPFIPEGVKICKTSEVSDSLNLSLVVANAQKFGKKSIVCIEEIPNDSFDLVIVDEAHHYPADTWKTIVDHFQNSKRLFLTATPYHKGEYILPNNQPPCFELSKDEAIERGIIRRIDFIEENQYDVLPNEAISLKIHEILNQHDEDDKDHKHQAMVLSGRANDDAEIFMQSYRDTCPGDDRCERYSGNNNDLQKKSSRVKSVFLLLLESF